MTYAAFPASAPSVPPGTPVHTRWGWINVLVPVATLPFTLIALWAEGSFFKDYVGQIAAIVASRGETGTYDPSFLDRQTASMMSLVFWLMLFALLGWALSALAVVAAYRDERTLTRLGYPQRFSWLWSLLGPVYPIGRAVVVRRQAGAGMATMWIAISTMVVSLLIVTVWSIWFLSMILGEFATVRGTMA